MLEELLQRLLGTAAPQNRLASVGMSPRAESAGYSYGPGGQYTGGGPIAGSPAPVQASAGYSAPQIAPASPGGGILGNLFGRRQQAGNATVGYLVRNGVDEGTATMMAQNPELLQDFLKQKMKPQEPQKPIEINGRLVDPNTYEVIRDFSTPKEDKQPWRALTAAEISAMGLPPGSYQMSPDGKVEPTVTPREQDAGFGRTQDIRKEIQQLPSYKNFAQAAPIYDTMVDASTRDNKAADLNLVYGLGKIFDPGSVVREGEMIMVKDTASLPDWFIGTIQSVNGGARLQPETRAAILREARSRIDAYKGMYDNDLGQYRKIAQAYGLDESLMLPPMPQLRDLPQVGAPTAPQPPAASGAQGTPIAPVARPASPPAARVPGGGKRIPGKVIPMTDWLKGNY